MKKKFFWRLLLLSWLLLSSFASFAQTGDSPGLIHLPNIGTSSSDPAHLFVAMKPGQVWQMESTDQFFISWPTTGTKQHYFIRYLGDTSNPGQRMLSFRMPEHLIIESADTFFASHYDPATRTLYWQEGDLGGWDFSIITNDGSHYDLYGAVAPVYPMVLVTTQAQTRMIKTFGADQPVRPDPNKVPTIRIVDEYPSTPVHEESEIYYAKITDKISSQDPRGKRWCIGGFRLKKSADISFAEILDYCSHKGLTGEIYFEGLATDNEDGGSAILLPTGEYATMNWYHLGVKIIDARTKTFKLEIEKSGQGEVTAMIDANPIANLNQIRTGSLINLQVTPMARHQIKSVTVDGKTLQAPNYPFALYKDTKVRVEFEPITHRVTLDNHSPDRGTVRFEGLDPAGRAQEGSTITVVAVPKPGYRLDYLVINGRPVVGPNHQFVLEKDSKVIVNFEAGGLNVTLENPNPHMGDVQLAGLNPDQEAQIGDKIKVIATPKQGYRIKSITANGLVLQGPDYEFTVQEDTRVLVEFEPISYSVTLENATPNMGNVRLEGLNQQQKATFGSQVKIVITVKAGHQIKAISVNDTPLNGPNYQFTVEKDSRVRVEFEPINYNVTLKIATPNMGEAQLAGLNQLQQAQIGDKIKVIATPKQGYRIRSITANGLVLQGPNYEFSLEQNTEVRVEFEKIPEVEVDAIEITVAVPPLQVGQQVQLSATVKPSSATNQTLTWSSSNAQVASVSPTGVITAHKLGKVTITAYASNGKSSTVVILVNRSAEDVEAPMLAPQIINHEDLKVGTVELFWGDVLGENLSFKHTLCKLGENGEVVSKVEFSGNTIRFGSAGTYLLVTTMSDEQNDWISVEQVLSIH